MRATSASCGAGAPDEVGGRGGRQSAAGPVVGEGRFDAGHVGALAVEGDELARRGVVARREVHGHDGRDPAVDDDRLFVGDVELRRRPAHGDTASAQERVRRLVVVAHEVGVEQDAHAHAATGVGGEDGRGLVVFELVDLDVDAAPRGAQQRIHGRGPGVGLDDQ